MQERKILSFDYTTCLNYYKEMLQLYTGCHINPGENIKLGHQSLRGILKTGLLKWKTSLPVDDGKHCGSRSLAEAVSKRKAQLLRFK